MENYKHAKMYELMLVGSIAEGLASLYAVLVRLGALPEPAFGPQTSLQKMWELRIAPLGCAHLISHKACRWC